jgi:hypothetical protein
VPEHITKKSQMLFSILVKFREIILLPLIDSILLTIVSKSSFFFILSFGINILKFTIANLINSINKSSICPLVFSLKIK